MTNLKKGGLALMPLLSLRGAEIPRLRFGTDSAISVEGRGLPRFARKDKANQQTAFSPLS